MVYTMWTLYTLHSLLNKPLVLTILVQAHLKPHKPFSVLLATLQKACESIFLSFLIFPSWRKKLYVVWEQAGRSRRESRWKPLPLIVCVDAYVLKCTSHPLNLKGLVFDIFVFAAYIKWSFLKLWQGSRQNINLCDTPYIRVWAISDWISHECGISEFILICHKFLHLCSFNKKAGVRQLKRWSNPVCFTGKKCEHTSIKWTSNSFCFFFPDLFLTVATARQ